MKAVRSLKSVCLTSVGMRDAGQSDFKNRHRIYDLETLAPYYETDGAVQLRVPWRRPMACRRHEQEGKPVRGDRTSPRQQMPNVLLQTLVRETNLWGYRPYPKNVIEYVVSRVDIDVWRCFSFLNDVRNMRTVAEVVMKRGRLFEPTVSFTTADWATNEYYLGSVKEIIDLCGGTGEIVFCVKDMAGVGTSTASAT